MSYNLFAHEEDDENHYGFRKNPQQEAQKLEEEEFEDSRINFELYTWPRILKNMKAGKAVNAYDAYDVRMYGSYKQRQEVEAYRKAFSAVKVEDASMTEEEKNKVNGSTDTTLPYTIPGNPEYKPDYLPLLSETENKLQTEPETLTYSIEVTEADPLRNDRNGIDITKELTYIQKEIFNWTAAVSIMREVNKPGTTNYSENEFIVFVRRSLKEGWLPGKTPVPNARNPRIIGWRGEVPIIEALNYDEAFLFARTHEPPFQKFDAYYIIKGWEILKNSGIELSSREGGLNRKNYELRAERGETMPYDLLYRFTNDRINYDKLKQYPNHKSKLQSNELVELIRGAQLKLNLEINGILSDDLINAIKTNKGAFDLNKDIRSKNDSKPVLIAKLYFISGDLTLYQKAIIEFEKLGDGIFVYPDFKQLADSASDILFYGSFMKEQYPADNFFRAIDNWEDRFKGDEQKMDMERVRILAVAEYNRTAPRREALQKSAEALEKQLNDPYRPRNYMPNYQGPAVSYEDMQLKLKLTGVQNELKALEMPALYAKYSNRETFYQSKQHYANLQHNEQPNWTAATFPTDNPFAKDNSQYSISYTGASYPYYYFSAASALTASHNFQQTNYDYAQFNTNMVQELGQTTSAVIAQREQQLFKQRVLTAQKLGSGNTVVQRWATLQTAYSIVEKNGLENIPGANVVAKATTVLQNDKTSVVKSSLPEQKDTYTFDAIYNSLENFKNRDDHVLLQQLAEETWQFFTLFKTSDYRDTLPPLLPNQSAGYSYRHLLSFANILYDYFSLGKINSPMLTERMREQTLSLNAMQRTQEKYGTLNLLPNRYLLRQDQEKVQKTNSINYERRSMLRDGVTMPMYWKRNGINYTLIVDQGDGEEKEVEYTLDKHIVDENTRDSYAINALIAKLEQWNGLPQGDLTFATPDKKTGWKTFEKHITWSEVLGWLAIAVFIVGAIFTGGASLGLIGLTSAALGVASAGMGLYEQSQVGNLSASDWALAGLSALSSVLPAAQLAGKLGTIGRTAGKFMGHNKLFAGVSAVSGIADTTINGYLMAEEFWNAYDQLAEITDPKERDAALERLLLMSLLNGALTWHSFIGDAAELINHKNQGHIIPDELIADVANKKIKPVHALPGQIGDAEMNAGKKIANQSNSSGTKLPASGNYSSNSANSGTVMQSGAHYNPATGHSNWQVKKQQTVTLDTRKNELGEIEYSRTDTNGKKILNKEQYENEIRFGKEIKRQQAISLADIEGRILDEAGNIDPEKLKEFFNELQSQGVQIMTGKNAEALLKKHNANALYLPGETPGQPGMIVLREGANKQHIIEEIFHLKQHEQEGFRTLGASEIIDMELEAHDQMLEYARTKGWTKEEIEQLERNKAAWENDRKKYNSDVEFRKKFDEEFGGFKNRDIQTEINARNEKLPSFCEITGNGHSFHFLDKDTKELIGMCDIDIDGFITFAIYRKGQQTKATGKDVFNSLMKNYELHGVKYNGINGVWTNSDNTTELNKLILDNLNPMSIDEAAKLTWTGQRAAEYGYINVEIVSKSPDFPPFSSVKVKFY
jgi:hypothetical protein